MKSFTQKINLIIIVTILFSVSVTYAQHRQLTRDSEKAYESQKFDDAVFLAINALMQDPSFGRAIEALQLALPTAIRTNESKIAQLKESTASFSGDYTVDQCQEIINRYNTLIKISDNLLNLPVVKPKKGDPVTFEIKNYNTEFSEAKNELIKNKELAAEQHYQSGLNLSKLVDIENSKSSAKEFAKAMSFVPNYKDASSLYEQARKLGTKRVAIIPFENKSGKNQYGAIGEMITDLIITNLLKNPSAMEFTEIISRDQLQQVIEEQKLGLSGLISENSAIEVGKILGVNELIIGQITQISSSQTPTTNKSYKNENTIYAKEGNYKVYANVTEYKKGASASINGSYKIIDVKTAKMVTGDSFKKDYSFVSQWATYSGDEKALSNESRHLCSQLEQNPPSDEDRVNIVSSALGNSLVQTIIMYVK
ncbi:MAG: CsgG/HfaB family protein [bacterium]|nr:CsgG/HfaB family protein [bacterium]